MSDVKIQVGQVWRRKRTSTLTRITGVRVVARGAGQTIRVEHGGLRGKAPAVLTDQATFLDRYELECDVRQDVPLFP